MTQLTELRGREARQINPRQDQLIEAVEILITAGWKFQPDQAAIAENPYTIGWWTLAGHPTKCRAVGDSRNLHFGAWDALLNYVIIE